MPSCQRELKAVVASPAAAVTTAEAPGQQIQQQMMEVLPQVLPQLPQVTQQRQQQVAQVAQVAEVAGRADVPKPVRGGPFCLMKCLRALQANIEDVKMALEAAEEPKNDFFQSAIILGGPSGMQKRPLLCVKVSEQGILCEGSTPCFGVTMLTIQVDQLEEMISKWPAPEEPEEFEKMDKELRTLIKAKYPGAEGSARAVAECPERLEIFEKAMVNMRNCQTP